MKYLIVVGCLVVSTPAVAQEISSPSGTISRYDAFQASNAITELGQYPCPNTGPGEQPTITCFLKVPVPMRSVLYHDKHILSEIVKENADATPPNATQLELAKVGQQRVPVQGLQKFTEEDLHLADNPQITPDVESRLYPLMKEKEKDK